MELAVNGEKKILEEGSTVAQLLEGLQIKPGLVVVEVNMKILKRAEHSQTELHEGDHVEIVRFVGGGASKNAEGSMPQARGQGICLPFPSQGSPPINAGGNGKWISREARKSTPPVGVEVSIL